MEYLYINSIRKNPSLCDGPGYRTVLFLQGCNLRCKHCQNKTTWNMSEGKKVSVDELATNLRKVCLNKKLTISGGEPLLQKDSLLLLFKLLNDFDICLYTGHEFKEIPEELLKYLKSVKVGPFVESLRTTTMPFIGSSNQKFIKLR